MFCYEKRQIIQSITARKGLIDAFCVPLFPHCESEQEFSLALSSLLFEHLPQEGPYALQGVFLHLPSSYPSLKQTCQEVASILQKRILIGLPHSPPPPFKPHFYLFTQEKEKDEEDSSFPLFWDTTLEKNEKRTLEFIHLKTKGPKVIVLDFLALKSWALEKKEFKNIPLIAIPHSCVFPPHLLEDLLHLHSLGFKISLGSGRIPNISRPYSGNIWPLIIEWLFFSLKKNDIDAFWKILCQNALELFKLKPL